MNTKNGAPETLVDAIRYFADPDTCLDFMVTMRWPNGVKCPSCGSTEVTFLSNQSRWKCRTRHPRQQFSAKVGTIFEDSPIGLDKWLPAVWMLVNDKNGISSYEVARALGVTQKTAWFMLHRIRLAMHTKSFGKIGGEIEVDETFIGGKARFMHKGRRAKAITGTGGAGKVAVMGMLERSVRKGHSKVRMAVVPNVRRSELDSRVRANVKEGSEVFTDALKSYDSLSQGFIHGVIDHSVAYVDGKIHTNGLENFWSLLKRGVKGTYVSIEPFHIFRYVDEQAFRFNNRKDNDGGRFVRVLRSIIGKRITYRALIGAEVSGRC